MRIDVDVVISFCCGVVICFVLQFPILISALYQVGAQEVTIERLMEKGKTRETR